MRYRVIIFFFLILFKSELKVTLYIIENKLYNKIIINR